jgi:hypothetical protein
MRGFDPGHGTYKSCEQKMGLSDDLKTVVPCTRVSMPGQAKDPTQVECSLLWTPYHRQISKRVTMPCNDMI